MEQRNRAGVGKMGIPPAGGWWSHCVKKMGKKGSEVNFPSYPAAQNSKGRSNMACLAWFCKGRFHPRTVWAPNAKSLDLEVVLIP